MKRSLTILSAILMVASADFVDAETTFTIADDGQRYVMRDDSGRELIAYQHAVYPAPEGVDPAFARSGFIHPLNTLAGQRLTQIQPADHYHHYGLWNPWTHTRFRGREIDFWNLAKKQGTVRFAGLLSKASGEHSASITVRHDHVVFNEDGTETLAIVEHQTIRVAKSAVPQAYTLDIESVYKCGSEDPITLLEYRYGGFGWRTTEVWNDKNSSVLTSAGIPREGSDGSLAKWCIVQGDIGGANAGAVVMSYPDNYNHPEPLRIWPESSHGGQIFFNFSPTKNRDWVLEPGQSYTQRYRMLVFDGPMNADTAEAAWQRWVAE